MGEININYDQALQEYPRQVEEVMGKIRKGKSKSKSQPPEAFEWSIVYAELIQGLSIQDLVTGNTPPEPTIEERLARLKDTIRVTIQATKGRGRWQSELLPEVPSQIYEARKASLEEDAAEQAIFQALSPEEQERGREELLEQLRGPGFIEISLP